VRLLQRFADPDIPLSAITDIIRPDPAITANILRAASSAEFGVGRPLSDLTRAVGLLGIRRVSALALCFSLSEDSLNLGTYAPLYRNVWFRCIVQAITAELLARRRSRSLEAEHFTAGLLADIGRLALLKAAPEDYATVANESKGRPAEEQRLQTERFGMTHSDLAITLFRTWRLPAQFSEAVRNRAGSPAALLELPSGEHRPLNHGIALATAVADYFCGFQFGENLARIFALCNGLYDMSADDTPEFLESVRVRVTASADLFRIDRTLLGQSADLMITAREHAHRLDATDESLDGQNSDQSVEAVAL
jgi:HD-like signal output (HDOD) protein